MDLLISLYSTACFYCDLFSDTNFVHPTLINILFDHLFHMYLQFKFLCWI